MSRPSTGPCIVDACDRPNADGHKICRMHRGRLRKHGTYGPPHAVRAPNRTGSVMQNGYVILTGVDHPLAGSQGKVLVHRVVLYDAIGPGPHPCHWCAKPVDWTYGVTPDALFVDHLDDDKTNNVLENLVPSCNYCNRNRERVA